jgi:hypothetical protein
MEIRFCDICNESVPEADLLHGRATVRAGRVVCAQCEHAMGGHFAEGGGHPGGPAGLRGASVAGGGALALAVAGDRAARAGYEDVGGPGARARAEENAGAQRASGAGSSGVGAAVTVGFVALAVGSAGAWLAIERIDALERSTALAVADLGEDLDAARRARASGAAELGGRIDTLRADFELAAAGLDGVVARGTEGLAKELAAAVAREAELRREVELARARTEEVLTLARQDRDSEARRIASLEIDLRMARDRLVAVEENLRVVGARTPSAAAGVAPVVAPEAPPPGPSWERHLADLTSTDEGIRVDAVSALGATRDKAVVPHLLPMLKDQNLWVRMSAAQQLGALGDRTAVPALIEALEDERSAVREEALVALQTLTGETLKFEPHASDSERAKRVRDWRDWWTKNRERLSQP